MAKRLKMTILNETSSLKYGQKYKSLFGFLPKLALIHQMLFYSD